MEACCAAPASRKKVVIAGFGDSGLTTAVHLASNKGIEIVGITPKPCHHSAQELGGRLAQPALWKELYLLPFETYRQLDGVRIIQGRVTRVDLDSNTVFVRTGDGQERTEEYDALLIASGCTNGFWRTTELESRSSLEATVQAEHDQVVAAATVAVVGGGPSGVNAAYSIACRFPSKAVHLFCSRDHILPTYHPWVRAVVLAKLLRRGVHVHYGHRASVKEGFTGASMTGSEPIEWSSGQPSFAADLIVWSIGRVAPNNAFIPAEILTAEGFVNVNEYLQVTNRPNVFSVGDIAASDPGRTTARNNGWALVGHNLSAYFTGRSLRRYRPPPYRWGSLLGPWDGLGFQVFTQWGWSVYVPLALWARFWPLVQRFLWAGMRNSVDWSAWCPPEK